MITCFSDGEYAKVYFEKEVVGRYFKILLRSIVGHPSMRAGALQCEFVSQSKTEATPESTGEIE